MTKAKSDTTNSEILKTLQSLDAEQQRTYEYYRKKALELDSRMKFLIKRFDMFYAEYASNQVKRNRPWWKFRKGWF